MSIVDDRLTGALDNLKASNRWLGGWHSVTTPLADWHVHSRRKFVKVLDLGTGRADLPAYLVQWGQKRGLTVEVTGVDNNEATIAYASDQLDRELPSALRDHVHLCVADALDLAYEDEAFDVVVAAQFMHHFKDEQIIAMLREMQRIAKDGVIVSDLHRHPVAYAGIWTIGHLLPVSPMFRQDGPISIQRGFKREDLQRYARAAALPTPTIRWQWAFRWLLTTLDV